MSDSERWTGFSREPLGGPDEPPWWVVILIVAGALMVFVIPSVIRYLTQ